MKDQKKIIEEELLEDILTKGPKNRRKFKITICFRENKKENAKKALEIMKSLETYFTKGKGRYRYHCAAFYPEQVEALHKLWQLISEFEYKKVYVNNYPLPYAQSLWLLLFWINRIK